MADGTDMKDMKNVKQFLYDFFRKRHFDLMSPEVRARYDDFAKKDDFAGNMKWWRKELDGTFEVTLDATKQQELFNLLQSAIEGMAADKKKYSHNAPVQAFIDKWFGQYKPFEASKAKNGDVKTAIDEVEKMLQVARPAFERIFRGAIITDDFSYDDLLDGIASKKYEKDIKFRDRLLRIIEHILYYGRTYGAGMYSEPSVWPDGLKFNAAVFDALNLPGLGTTIPGATGPIPGGVNDWFEATFDQPKFENVYPVILSELLEKENIRKEFARYESSGKIIGQLDKAIEATNYADPNKPDYIPPKAVDSNNIIQTVNKWIDNTYESYLRKFKEPGRGTRIFFTPFSQTIMQAIDKEKIKPTDGIAGILSKKDAITKRLAASSPQAKSHFDWFAKTMGEISKLVPNAYEGAMKGGRQLQDVVSQLIIKAVESGKVAEAKTALEILAVSKYGLTTSKRMDAIAKDTQNMALFSDKSLSWNKNEGVRFVTSAMDKTLRFGLLATGRAVAAAHNAVQRSRAKFNGDIRTNDDLRAAYDKWTKKDAADKLNAEKINGSLKVDTELQKLETGAGKSGEIIKDDTTLAAAESKLKTLTKGTPDYDNLETDIEQYKQLSERKNLVDNWRSKNKDNYHDLVAYWDLMMSAMKTHSFRLGTLAMRSKFLNNNRGKNIADNFIANYGKLRA